MSLKNDPTPVIIKGKPEKPGAVRALNVPQIAQEQTMWCWAACCEMVFRFYNITNVRQCQMATAAFGGNCCAAPSTSGCNQGEWPELTYQRFAGIAANRLDYTLAFASIKAEIDAGRPVEVYYAWSGGGAHVAIIRGYNDNGDLDVNDPALGTGPRAYSTVLNGYGYGAWTMTWINLRR